MTRNLRRVRTIARIVSRGLSISFRAYAPLHPSSLHGLIFCFGWSNKVACRLRSIKELHPLTLLGGYLPGHTLAHVVDTDAGLRFLALILSAHVSLNSHFMATLYKRLSVLTSDCSQVSYAGSESWAGPFEITQPAPASSVMLEQPPSQYIAPQIES
jgi:hypothetical protein